VLCDLVPSWPGWDSVCAFGAGFISVAEEEHPIQPGPLAAALGETVGHAARFRRQPRFGAEELRQLVLEHELGEAALAELLAEADERLVADLLAEREAAGRLPRVHVRRGDLEQIDVERLADRPTQRRGDEAAGDAAGGLRQRGALAGAELVDRAVEDDERQDVGLVERRR